MSVYVVALLRFTNVNSYRLYQEKFGAVFSLYSGELLVADEHPLVLEGDWDQSKVIIMRFPDEEKAQRFLTSPEYSAISRDRRAGAEATALLARGLM